MTKKFVSYWTFYNTIFAYIYIYLLIVYLTLSTLMAGVKGSNKRNHRANSNQYNNFDYYFKKLMSSDEEEILDQIKACQKYQTMKKKDKTNIFKQMEKQMQIPFNKLQKHYANVYRKCLYNDQLDEFHKQFVIRLVYDALVKNQESEKGLHTRIKQKLKQYKVNIFPGTVDAYITEIKPRIKKGRIKDNNVLTLEELLQEIQQQQHGDSNLYFGLNLGENGYSFNYMYPNVHSFFDNI